MDELEAKKKEVADIDNLRIERDGILSQISSKTTELSELTTKTEQDRSTLALVNTQIDDAKKERDRIGDETAKEVRMARADTNERAASVAAGEKKLEQDRNLLADQTQKALDKDISLAERERNITSRETSLTTRENTQGEKERQYSENQSRKTEQLEETQSQVLAREGAVGKREEESTKKEELLRLQRDDVARDRAKLEGDTQSHETAKTETDATTSANRTRATELDKQAEDTKMAKEANEAEKTRLEAFSGTLGERERQLGLRELELRVATKKVEDRERAVQLKEQL